MRTLVWVAAAVAGLALAAPAKAQMTVTFGGVNPTQTVNVPIDTSSAIAPFPQPQLTNPLPSGLQGFFARLFTFPGRFGFFRRGPSPAQSQAATAMQPFNMQMP